MRPVVDKALWAIGAGVGLFGIGVFAALHTPPSHRVFITNQWSFVPAAQPGLNGLFVVANGVGVVLAVLLGRRLVIGLFRSGALFAIVGAGMLAAGLGAGFLAIAGGWLMGMTLDQRLGMVICFVVVGGMGGLMFGADLRGRWRARKKQKT